MDKLNLKELTKDEKWLYRTLAVKMGFLLIGDVMPTIEKMCAAKGLNLLVVDLQSWEQLHGKQTIIESPETGAKCFYNDLLWAHPILENTDKEYLLLFLVDNADKRTICALKSIADAHVLNGQRPGNFFVGLMTKKEGVVEDTDIIYLLSKHKWNEE